MTDHGKTPALRFVDAPRRPASTPLPSVHTGRVGETARALLTDSILAASDARWILAVDVVANLSRGRDAVISPGVRRRLLDEASAMGLRPFDANLVIAVVQDAARHGEDPLGPLAEGRLRLVRPVRRRAWSRDAARFIGAGVIACSAVSAVMAWIASR